MTEDSHNVELPVSTSVRGAQVRRDRQIQMFPDPLDLVRHWLKGSVSDPTQSLSPALSAVSQVRQDFWIRPRECVGPVALYVRSRTDKRSRRAYNKYWLMKLAVSRRARSSHALLRSGRGANWQTIIKEVLRNEQLCQGNLPCRSQV